MELLENVLFSIVLNQNTLDSGNGNVANSNNTFAGLVDPIVRPARIFRLVHAGRCSS
jgi:hypothetical protein